MKSALTLTLGALVLSLGLVTACSSTGPSSTLTPTPGVITFKEYIGLGNPSPFFSGAPEVRGRSIPAKQGERIDSLTWGFGSGQWGYRSIHIDRSGAVTTVDVSDHEQDVEDYLRQQYRVAPADAAAVLDSPALRRCLSLRPYHAAVGINDGAQDFLRIDSGQHTRRFWFNNYSPPALQVFGNELETWLQHIPATRTGRPQRVSSFQASRDCGISEWLRSVYHGAP